MEASLAQSLRETAVDQIEVGQSMVAQGREMLGRIAIIYGDEQTFGRQLNLDYEESFDPEVARPGW